MMRNVHVLKTCFFHILGLDLLEWNILMINVDGIVLIFIEVESKRLSWIESNDTNPLRRRQQD